MASKLCGRMLMSYSNTLRIANSCFVLINVHAGPRSRGSSPMIAGVRNEPNRDAPRACWLVAASLPPSAFRGRSGAQPSRSMGRMCLLELGLGVATLTCVPVEQRTSRLHRDWPDLGRVNGSVTLAANCSPAATSWVWSGGSCGTGSTTTRPARQLRDAGRRQLHGTGSNANGPGDASGSKVVNWTNSLPANRRAAR